MHWLDILLLVILVASAFKGYQNGAIHQVLTLLSFLISIRLANRVVPYLAQYFDFLGTLLDVAWVSWLVGFLLCFIVCSIAARLIRSLVTIPFGTLDNILGMVVGVGVAILFLGLLLNIYAWLSTTLMLPPIPESLKIAPWVQSITETLMNDYLFEIVGESEANIMQEI